MAGVRTVLVPGVSSNILVFNMRVPISDHPGLKGPQVWGLGLGTRASLLREFQFYFLRCSVEFHDAEAANLAGARGLASF